MNCCQWLSGVTTAEEAVWGKEGVDLSLLSTTGVPILPSLLLYPEVYSAFFQERAVRQAITKATKGLNPKAAHHFSQAATEVRKVINNSSFPASIEKSVTLYFEQFRAALLQGNKRSLPLRLSFLNLPGEIVIKTASSEGLQKGIRQLYALQFTDEELHKRFAQNTSVIGSPLAILIQYYPEPEVSGVAQMHDPESHDDTVAVITASPGTGKATPASEAVFRVNSKDWHILGARYGSPQWSSQSSGRIQSTKRIPVQREVLGEEKAVSLARLMATAQKVFSEPRVFEWVLIDGHPWFKAVHPLSKAKLPQSLPNQAALSGLSGNLGKIAGPIRKILKEEDKKRVKAGDVVVVSQLVNSDIEWLTKIGAVISQAGNKTGIEARLAKRLGIPAVVGVTHAFALLKEGELVTVDGTTGKVTSGKSLSDEALLEEATLAGTKLYATILDLSQPFKVSSEDGLLLLGSDSLLRLLGMTPSEVVQRGRQAEYTSLLAETITEIAKAAYPRPIIYQFHEPSQAIVANSTPRIRRRIEPNPTLGYRGSYRMLQEPALLDMEIAALQQVLEQPKVNLQGMLPMVRSVEEVVQLQERLKTSLQVDNKPLPLWIMCQTPAMAILAEALVQLPIAGVCIDVSVFAQLTTGIDATNRQMAHHLQQSHPAVLQALDYLIEVCRDKGIATIITGGIDPLEAEVVEMAVRAGVIGMAVDQDILEDERHLILTLERRILLDQLLDESEGITA